MQFGGYFVKFYSDNYFQSYGIEDSLSLTIKFSQNSLYLKCQNGS